MTGSSGGDPVNAAGVAVDDRVDFSCNSSGAREFSDIEDVANVSASTCCEVAGRFCRVARGLTPDKDGDRVGLAEDARVAGVAVGEGKKRLTALCLRTLTWR